MISTVFDSYTNNIVYTPALSMTTTNLPYDKGNNLLGDLSEIEELFFMTNGFTNCYMSLWDVCPYCYFQLSLKQRIHIFYISWKKSIAPELSGHSVLCETVSWLCTQYMSSVVLPTAPSSSCLFSKRGFVLVFFAKFAAFLLPTYLFFKYYYQLTIFFYIHDHVICGFTFSILRLYCSLCLAPYWCSWLIQAKCFPISVD